MDVIGPDSAAAAPTCWCGNPNTRPYSPEYALCAACGTLVSRAGLAPGEVAVDDDDHAFYGREYWLSHQSSHLGNPDIVSRTRTDLPERCMHWLRTILRYKAPPARVLEIGCAHGGFVALLRWAGYDATGLELSPWVVEYARRTFDVPVLLGPVEGQSIEPGSLDAVVLNDVVEHLPDPVGTLRACGRLLAPDGVLLVQMPSFPEGATFDELVARKSPFLPLMVRMAKEHVHLFSPRAARLMFERLGFPELDFVRAQYAVHDMYFVAGRRPLVRTDPEGLAQTMTATAEGRLTLAWLDLLTGLEPVQAELVARLDVIQRLDADCAARLDVIRQLEAAGAARLEAFRRLDADCAARLDVIRRLEADLHLSNATRQRIEADLRQAWADTEAHRTDADALRADRVRLTSALAERTSAGLARRATRALGRSLRALFGGLAPRARN
jgi:SAM-dependent methyltransferase